MDFRATLELIASGLPPQNHEWAVIGGIALGILGAPRTTLDLDLLIAEAALPRLDAILLGSGWRLAHRWDESSHFASDDPKRCPVDVLHARRAHTRRMLAEVLSRNLEGTEVPVVRPEDLIGLKLQGLVNDPERERSDGADIRRLLVGAAATGQPLDGARVREYFELFGRSQLLAALLEGLDGALA